MLFRFTLFAAALLMSAALQARTPYACEANKPTAEACGLEVPVLSDRLLPAADGPWQRPPSGSRPSGETGELVLDSFPAVPRHAINWALGLASSTQGAGPLTSLGYAYRLKGKFWVGGMLQYELRDLVPSYIHEIKLLEMNYWELPLFRWLALRLGIGIGMAIYQSDIHSYSAVMGRIMIQWVVQLGNVVSLTLSPILVGPSCLDIGYSPIGIRSIEESCDMMQIGLSFRF